MTQALDIALLACSHWDCITGTPHLFMHRENSVFKVDTIHGPAALRVHRHGYHSTSAILSEMQWMAHLAAEGLQVPLPLCTADNRMLVEIEDHGKTYVVDLLTWLEGTPLGNATDALAFGKSELQQIFFNLGRTIARMHDISDKWVLPVGFTRHAWDGDGFAGEQPFWGAFWNAGDLTMTERKTLQQARSKAKRALEKLRKGGADYGLIHADFVRQNILLEGTDVRVIDFDDSGFGFRMYDFATALVKNRGEPHYAAIKQALLDGYRSKRVLSKVDEDSIGLFLTLRDFAYLGWMDARRHESGVEERMAGIRAVTLVAAEEFLISQPMA